MPGKHVTPASKRIPLLAALVIAVAFPVLFWVNAVGDLRDYLHYGTPPGQLWYVFSKLAGLTAISLLVVQVTLITLRHFRVWHQHFDWPVTNHKIFGLMVLCFNSMHVGSFVTAASYRGEQIALDLFIPIFNHGSYRSGVSLGATAFWIILATGLIGLFGGKLAGRLKAVHRLGALALVLVIAHAYIIGSEKIDVIVLAAFGAMALGLMLWRVAVRRPAPCRATRT